MLNQKMKVVVTKLGHKDAHKACAGADLDDLLALKVVLREIFEMFAQHRGLIAADA